MPNENELTENVDGWSCSDCGGDLSEHDKVCPNCGADLSETTENDDEPIVNSSEQKEKQKTPYFTTKSQIFSKDEKVIAILGQKFVISFISGGGFTQTSIMLTDKRLYASGTNYSSKGKAYQTVIGEVRSLHTIGLSYTSNFWLLALGLPLLLLYGAGIIFIGLYFWTRHRYIQLNFGGELTSLSLRGISNNEVENFIKKVMIEKEKISH